MRPVTKRVFVFKYIESLGQKKSWLSYGQAFRTFSLARQKKIGCPGPSERRIYEACKYQGNNSEVPQITRFDSFTGHPLPVSCVSITFLFLALRFSFSRQALSCLPVLFLVFVPDIIISIIFLWERDVAQR